MIPGDNLHSIASDPTRGDTTRIRTVACLCGGISIERGVTNAEMREHLDQPDNVIWMDVQDPGPDELAMFLGEFGFHPLALEDLAKGEQRPRVDEYKDYMFVVTYGMLPGDDAEEFRTVEVDLFIGRNYLVTVHRAPIPALDDAMTRWTRGGLMLREGVGFLAYTVMDAIIDSYSPIMDAIEKRLDAPEVEAPHRAEHGGVESLLRIKRTLYMLRRVLYPLRETYQAFLRPDQPFFSANTRVYFEDVYNHILRVLDGVDMELDMVNGTLEGHLTIISSRLNTTMKRLTIITVIVAFAGMVFGAWGMNFEHIPLSDTTGGFWMVLGCTVLLIVTALFISRKRGWL